MGLRRGSRSLLLAGAVMAMSAASVVAAPADDGPLRYVALGDSYTSGPLVLPHDTTHVPQDCGQSVQNYPHVAAAILGAELVDVSCGSATIDDFTEPQGGLPLGGTNAPQFDALDQGVDVVTVGIGGNDVGYVGVALDCIRVLGPPHEQPCTPAPGSPEADEVSRRIAETADELAAALQQIREVAPRARIYVVNYPTSLPDDARGCWPYVPILAEDMPYLVEKFKEMNAMLAAVAEAEGAVLIDIYTPSIGHDACQPPGLAWVNGVVVVPPSFPAHPNGIGLAMSGRVVADAIAADLGIGRGGLLGDLLPS